MAPNFSQQPGDEGMPNINNYPNLNNKLIKAVRGLLEHRAIWLSLA